MPFLSRIQPLLGHVAAGTAAHKLSKMMKNPPSPGFGLHSLLWKDIADRIRKTRNLRYKPDAGAVAGE